MDCYYCEFDYLKLSWNYEKKINELPLYAKFISVSDEYYLYSCPVEKYFKNIKYLIVGAFYLFSLKNLPNTLTHLIIDMDIDLKYNIRDKIIELPDNLELVIFTDLYIKNLIGVCKNLLTVGFCKDYKFSYNIPESVTTLIFFSNTFVNIKKNPIPLHIEKIYVYGDLIKKFTQMVKIPWGCKIVPITNCIWGFNSWDN
jgi:hypothetical protein